MAGSILQTTSAAASAASSGTTQASGNQASNPTVGNFLMVICGSDTQTCTVADTLGNTFTEQGTGIAEAAITQKQHLFIAPITTGGGTNSITATFGASVANRYIVVHEITGVGAFDVFGVQTDTGTNPTASVTATNTAQPGIAIAVLRDLQGKVSTQGAGYTIGPQLVLDDNTSVLTEFKATSTIGSQSANFANTGFDRSTTVFAIFTDIAPPSFTLQPSNISIFDGQTATFNSTATSNGGTGLGYQWQDNSSGSFADIGGATSASYTTVPLVASGAAGRKYRCNATDSNGTTASNTVTLNFFTWPRAKTIKKRRRPNGIGWFPGALWAKGTVKTGVQNWLLRGLAQPASGGPANYTITAASGSYAYTGQAATLTKTRILTAAAGSYAYTGQPASLKFGRLLTAAHGSYTYTGQAASILKTRVLTAASGAYTYTGQAAGLLHSRLLTAASGSYAVSGQAATITYTPLAGAYTLTAETGVYTYTGQPASIVYVASQVTQAAPSGGYGSFYDFELHSQRRRRAREEAERLAEEAEQAQEDELQAELAKRLHAELARQEELNELQRLRLLVAKHRDLVGASDAVQKAFLRAKEQASFSRLQALQREFAKSLEEEEMALLMILLADV